MPTTSEILELILKVSGGTEGQKLEQQLAAIDTQSIRTREDMDDLEAALQKGKVTADEYADFLDLLTKELQQQEAATAKLAAGLEKTAAAQQKAADAAKTSAEKAALSQAASAQRAADAVQAASDKINAAFIKEGLDAEAAAKKRFDLAARAAQADYSRAEKAEAAGNKVSRAMSDSQTRITALSYAFNDFFSVSGGFDQRLNAIANNLPLLLSGFGNIGLALSGIVPVAAMVIKNWDDIQSFLGIAVAKSKDHLQGLEAKVKELSDKKVQLPIDVLQLQEAKKEVEAIKDALQAIDKLKKTQGTFQKESGGQIEGVLAEAEGGAAGVAGKLKGSMAQDLLAAARANAARITAEIKAEIANNIQIADALLMEGSIAAAQKVRGDVEAGRAKLNAAEGQFAIEVSNITKEGGAADIAVGKLLAAAQNAADPKAQAEAQARLAGRMERAGLGKQGGRLDAAGMPIPGEGLAEAVRLSSPENIEAQEKADAAFDFQLERKKAQHAKALEIAKEQGQLEAVQTKISLAEDKTRQAQFEHDQAIAAGGMGFLPPGGGGGGHGGAGAGVGGIGPAAGMGMGAGIGIGMGMGMGMGLGGPVPGVGRIMVGAGQPLFPRRFLTAEGIDTSGRPDVIPPRKATTKRERIKLQKAARAARVKAIKDAKAQRLQRIHFANAARARLTRPPGSTIGAATAGPKPGESPLRPLVANGQQQVGVLQKTVGTLANLNVEMAGVQRKILNLGGQVEHVNDDIVARMMTQQSHGKK